LKDVEEEELEDDHKGSGNKTKLKASDIYSDDSGSSDSAEEEEEQEEAKSSTRRRLSSSESRDSDSDNDKKLVILRTILYFSMYQFIFDIVIYI
jgi:RNA polymerase-associated protein RTF1